MKIIITGGAGFIGSHLADACIEAGHKVGIVDNLDTGFREFINGKAKFYKIDITDSKGLEGVFKKEKPDLVAHLAAFDHIRLSVERPEDAINVNVIGTLNVLKMMVRYKAKKIIFASTAGPLYGFKPKPLPIKEDGPIQSVSPYGATKAFGEELIKLWSRLYGIKYTIFRYPNVYGPRQFPKAEAKAVAVFSLGLLNGKRPVLFGNGTKARDYDYIDDVTRAHILALKKGDNETINLGWGKPVTDMQLLNAVQKGVGTKIKPIIGKAKPGEVYRYYLDCSKAKKILGWQPEVPLKEGIEKTIEYYRKCRAAQKVLR